MLISILLFTVLLVAYLWWGFTVLPAERWQILASVPVVKSDEGHWKGVNLTWYGFLTANAYVVAVVVLFVLLGGVGVPLSGIATLAVAMLLCCVPASRLVARLVEKKSDTFTVGGAVFVGILIAPWVVMLVNRTAGTALSFEIPPLAALAAISIAYSFGEGLGRLACISFGCCYGKPLDASPPWLQKIFGGFCFVYSGKTKKIAYAHGLDGHKVLPVQAVTAILYSVCGLVAAVVYLLGYFAAAFLLATIVTQLWRTLSETMRADYRGAGKISAYQYMGIAGVAYAVAITSLFRQEAATVLNLAAGAGTLWNPFMLLFLQLLWLAIFVYTGRSTVTGAEMRFHVHHDRI